MWTATDTDTAAPTTSDTSWTARHHGNPGVSGPRNGSNTTMYGCVNESQTRWLAAPSSADQTVTRSG